STARRDSPPPGTGCSARPAPAQGAAALREARRCARPSYGCRRAEDEARHGGDHGAGADHRDVGPRHLTGGLAPHLTHRLELELEPVHVALREIAPARVQLQRSGGCDEYLWHVDSQW